MWEYRDITDQMSGRVIHTATIASAGAVPFGKLNGGPQVATITLRASDQEAGDVMLSFAMASFSCAPAACSVLLTFDKRKAVRCSTWKPSDKPLRFIFLQCADRFRRDLLTAKKLRIDAAFDNDGSRQMTFNVSGLVWPPH